MCRAEPFVPKDGRQVLERLRAVAFDPEARELRNLHTRLAAAPGNVHLALELARHYIERSRADADPRYLGRAQAALTHWWDDPQPPVAVLVLRATIKQSQHDFTNALADLDRALQSDPANAQARLTRATILTVLGRYAEARRACLPLARLAPGLVAITAAASVTSLTGEAERSCALLEKALDESASAPTSEKLWALGLLAETSARLDRAAEAEQFYRRAIALGQRDSYLLGAYADFLLDQGRAQDAASLLQGETRADGLLLRLALAEKSLAPRPPGFDAHVASLGERFEASRLRGDRVHQREEARFTLHLLGRPQSALLLAQQNWDVQHEPSDARILLEAALATQARAAAQPVFDFIQTNHLEDARLARLASQITGQAAR